MKEEWQFQPGMGSLGLWREPGTPTQRFCSQPRSIRCVECTRDDGRHLIHTILFGHRLIFMDLIVTERATKAQA